MKRSVPIVFAALSLVLLGLPVSPAGAATGPIVLIFEENQDYTSIVGNSGQAPYLNGTMIPSGLLATNYTQVAPGSLPDYLGATSGNPGPKHIKATLNYDNLFNQLQVSGHTQRSYEENMPSPCYLGSSYGTSPGNYDKGHDPEAYYADIVNSSAVCTASILPAGTATSINSPAQLIADAQAGKLADFNFVTPNDCDNMHSCSITTGDTWLSQVVPPLEHAGATVIVTWDEGSTSTHVPLIAVGAGISAGGRYATLANHYSLLAALEDHFSVPRLGNAVGAVPLPLG